ncbi:hypothetical protein [Saccharomonospora piscinae]|uniref:hypothetical protein n=1 Tax=Saccharomonospora piscinae TaxID=687388 RepID=UPI00046387BE|nr:hypothetical protein [Saccharomonospora piscinae]
MRRRVSSIVATAAAATFALGFSAMSASAQQQEWVIDPGGDYTAASGTTVLTNTSTGVTLNCSGSDAEGSLNTNASGSPAQIGTIAGISWENCSGPLGLSFDVEPQNLPWSINGESYDAATGVTTGSIGGVTAVLSGTSCNATVEGATPGTYDNGSDTLAPGPIAGSPHELTVTYVDPGAGCFGLINTGDTVTFEGAYVVSPGQDVTLQ